MRRQLGRALLRWTTAFDVTDRLGYPSRFGYASLVPTVEAMTEQLAGKAVPPSNISLLGLVRHLARVEQSWFRRVIEARAAR